MSDPDDFDAFWLCYPRKVNKGDARKAWLQTASIRPPIAELLAAVELGKSSVQWHRADREGVVGAFIPYPATYLRGEQWENEYTIQLSSIKTRPIDRAPEVKPPSPEEIKRARELVDSLKLKRIA
jgi:hypothetical protein